MPLAIALLMIVLVLAASRALYRGRSKRSPVPVYIPPNVPVQAPKARVAARAYTPKPGFDWNPLRHHRNVACPCGSNKKAKRCHGRLDLLPLEDLAKVKEYLRRLSLAGVITASPGEIK